MDYSILEVAFPTRVHTDNLLQSNNLDTSAISSHYAYPQWLTTNER